MSDYSQACAFVFALTGDANTVFDWRCIHDKDKAVPGINRRGTIADCWQELCYWNAQGYGIFAIINETDGNGRKLENIRSNRAHFIDLDNLQSVQNLQRASQHNPPPTLCVQSSPNKFHVYWRVLPYSGNDAFAHLQRKLAQFFESDPKVIDPAHVMRVPGFYHTKGEPYLSHCWQLPGYGFPQSVDMLQLSLAQVQVIAGGYGLRKPLGDPELAAPSLEWIKYALNATDPNTLSRADWISLTAAVKQAGWTLATPQELFDIWSFWCSRYAENNPGENLKQWNDLTETQLGWKSIVNRTPQVKAYLSFGGKEYHAPPPSGGPSPAPVPGPSLPPDGPSGGGPIPDDGIPADEILTPDEQRRYFRGCYIVTSNGGILTPDKQMTNQTTFNARFGGRIFIISSTGKTTDEPYKAVTRGTQFRLPMVDELRFLPHMPPDAIVTNGVGRRGINTYIAPKIGRVKGDVLPFLRHLGFMLPNANDRHILLSYMAHNAQFPGKKIPWSVLLQSAEGAGKGIFKAIFKYIATETYFYSPNAKDLSESGAKFNKWMRNRLMIVVDEIRTDERREMIEVLKPFISEETIEVQGKGADQQLEDNFSNWAFFSNYKDAIPININSRRFAIFFSALQSATDIQNHQMGKTYFDGLWFWLKESSGFAIIYDYLMTYDIGEMPNRAPITSSLAEAVWQSQGTLERLVNDAVTDGLPGFRGGWVSTAALSARIKMAGQRSVSPQTLERVLDGMGYHYQGRALRAYLGEEPNMKASLFHGSQNVPVEGYAAAQGYEK